MSISCWFSFTS